MRVTKAHPNSAVFCLKLPLSYHPDDFCGTRNYPVACVGEDFIKNTWYFSFKCASQKYCNTNPKFQFSNYCQQVLKLISFLFKGKDSANTERISLPQPTSILTLQFSYRANPSAGNQCDSKEVREWDQVTFCQIRIWFTKKKK